MQSNLEKTLAEMEELEFEETIPATDLVTNSTTDCKYSLENLETEDSSKVMSQYAALYKTTKVPVSQEKRRKKLLEDMKLRRNQVLNQKRGLLEVLCNESGELDNVDIEETELEEEPMDVVVTKYKRRKRRRRSNIYTNQLMLSEWFAEIPADLESQWLMKLCPVGIRNLVVAHYGITRAFSKSGVLLSTFQSALPGGNKYLCNIRTCTILDCIYSPKFSCYYILDVIAWRNYDLQLSDAEFRFFWLKSKLDESPDLKEVNGLNEHRFYELESVPAELPLIQEKLSQPYKINNEVILIDGVLFYHRATHYICSQTPLVGWLKPFMVPEMLHIPVDECFMKKMPSNYKSMQDYRNNGRKSVKNKKSQSSNEQTFTEVEMEI